MLKDKSKVGTNWANRGLEEDVNLPMVELEAMFKSGQRDFVFYENKKGGVRYDLKGDVKEIRTLVYSVIGKTQFKLNINCK
jgi:acyl CoA:acetate/3-ketoacid CoA transferase alpha subunit